MNEQEAADLAAFHLNNEIADLFEVTYRGGRLSDNNVYTIPNVPFRLIIYDSVTVIDMSACYRCTTLIEVILRGTNVTQIGRNAFRGCRNLQRIELPAGLLRLESFAFDGCTSLRGEIVIPATVHLFGSCIFEDCSSLESVVFVPRTTSIELGYGMFWGCSNLRFVTLPHNVRSIPARFFMGCTLFAAIRIPPSVQRIERDAFSGSAIQSIVMLEKVHQIDREAFKNCAFLERVTIHSTNLNLATDIFVNCPLLSVIKMYPYLWPTLFASMNEHPEFIFKFFREYQTQIFDFQIVNPDDEVEGEGTLHNNREDNNE